MTSPTSERRPTSNDVSIGTFVAGVTTLTIFGFWLRWHGLSRGSLYRDDAWVALTRRVPWHTAWHMVGTAPGFVMVERLWVWICAPSTWWAQIPTLVVATVGLVVFAVVATWWGLSRRAAIFATFFIVVSPVAVTYATHLKPYSHDILATTLVLAAAEWWRRDHSAWPFALVSVISLATAFDPAPLIAGVAVAMVIIAVRGERWRQLLAPGVCALVPVVLLYLAVRDGISPQLATSWKPNFVQFDSLHSILHSTWTITSGLVTGFVDVAPHLHIPGYAKSLIVLTVVLAVAGAFASRANALAAAGVIGAVLGAACHLVPLGTGRTDAYLYPALALLVAGGIHASVAFLRTRQPMLSRVSIIAVLVFSLATAMDLATHRPTYPGGSIDPVAHSAQSILASGGAVLIEGTARWPWTYYEERHVHLVFSDKYNTGFAPLSDNPNVVIMPGTTIEGGYNPTAAVAALGRHRQVLYVRTDDWPALGDPLQAAFRTACFEPVRAAHVPGYLEEWLTRRC